MAVLTRLPGAGHGRAEVLGGHRARVDVGDEPAAQDHLSVSDRPISSSRSAEISSTARPPRAGVADVLPDRRLGADVHAARRVGRDAAPWARGSSRARRSASAGCRRTATRRATSMPGGADVVLRDDPLGVCAVAPPGRSSGPLTLGFWVWWPSMRFSHSGASSSRPWRWRSSGM